MAADTVTENWKPVVGFEGRYEVSDLGRVRSLLQRPGVLILKNSRGYRVASLSTTKSVAYLSVHRVVLIAFVGPPAAGHECDHINGDRSDNRLHNLRWVTKSENQRAMFHRHGGAPWWRREGNPQSKLNEKQVRLARTLAQMNLPRGWKIMLTRAWGLSDKGMTDVFSGRNWKSTPWPSVWPQVFPAP